MSLFANSKQNLNSQQRAYAVKHPGMNHARGSGIRLGCSKRVGKYAVTGAVVAGSAPVGDSPFDGVAGGVAGYTLEMCGWCNSGEKSYEIVQDPTVATKIKDLELQLKVGEPIPAVEQFVEKVKGLQKNKKLNDREQQDVKTVFRKCIQELEHNDDPKELGNAIQLLDEKVFGNIRHVLKRECEQAKSVKNALHNKGSAASLNVDLVKDIKELGRKELLNESDIAAVKKVFEKRIQAMQSLEQLMGLQSVIEVLKEALPEISGPVNEYFKVALFGEIVENIKAFPPKISESDPPVTVVVKAIELLNDSDIASSEKFFKERMHAMRSLDQLMEFQSVILVLKKALPEIHGPVNECFTAALFGKIVDNINALPVEISKLGPPMDVVAKAIKLYRLSYEQSQIAYAVLCDEKSDEIKDLVKKFFEKRIQEVKGSSDKKLEELRSVAKLLQWLPDIYKAVKHSLTVAGNDFLDFLWCGLQHCDPWLSPRLSAVVLSISHSFFVGLDLSIEFHLE